MNLKSYSLVFLLSLVFSVSGRAFYNMRDELHLDDNKIGLEPYKDEGPLNWKFVKRNDLFEVHEGILCFQDTYSKFISECFDKFQSNNWFLFFNQQEEKFIAELFAELDKEDDSKKPTFLILTRYDIELPTTNFEHISYIDSATYNTLKQKYSDTSKNLLYGSALHHFASPKKESYDAIKWLVGAFFIIGLLFTISYLISYNQQSNKIVEGSSIEAIHPRYREQVRIKLTTMLIMLLVSEAVLFFIANQVPYKPFSFEDGGDKTASILFFLFYPLTQAYLTVGVFYLSSFVLRSTQKRDEGRNTQVILFVFAFVVSFLLVFLKNLKVRYAFIPGLLYSLYMIIPYSLWTRDCNDSRNEFRQRLLNDQNDDILTIHCYKLYQLFGNLRYMLTAFFISTFILGIFAAILPEGLWQMCLITLTIIQSLILFGMALMFLPKNWMSNEITIENRTIVHEVYKIKGNVTDNTNMLLRQQQEA